MQHFHNRQPWAISSTPLAFVFDIHGVLADIRLRRIFDDEAVVEFLEKEVGACNELWEAYDLGLPYSGMIAEMAKRWPQYRHVYEKYVYHYADSIVLNQDVINLALQLKYMGCHISILSNIGEQDVSELMYRYPVFRMFNGHTFSGYVRMRKPNEDIYRHHVRACKLEPAECFLIDDLEENVAMAKSLGWGGYTFDNIFKLEKAINERFDISVKGISLPNCLICREERRKG